MKSVYQFLKSVGLINKKGVDVSLVDSLSKREIYETVEFLLHLTETKRPQIAQTTFTHSASQSLAGRAKCTYLPHRLAQLGEVARFAAMYSDCVYVENFFLDYEHFISGSVTNLRETLHDDLWMLIAMKPLLEAKRIQLYTPEMHYCLNCFETVFGANTKRKIERGYKRLSNEYFQNSTVSLIEYNKHVCKFELEGPEPFYEHPMVLIFPGRKNKIHDIVTANPHLLKKFKKGSSAQLSQSLATQLQLHRKFAGTIANSATFGMLSSRILKTSFLTDNTLDVSFLQTISNSPEIDARNQIALKHLTSVVPFVADVRIADLIKLRRREEAAFLNYRRALNEAIDEFKSHSAIFGEKQAREIYSDVVAPQLAALDKRISIAKRDLVKKSVRSIVAVAGVISFGLYTGFIPAEIAELVKTVGLGKIAVDVVEKAMPIGEAVSSVKNDDLYFLWKTKKLVK